MQCSSYSFPRIVTYMLCMANFRTTFTCIIVLQLRAPVFPIGAMGYYANRDKFFPEPSSKIQISCDANKKGYVLFLNAVSYHIFLG